MCDQSEDFKILLMNPKPEERREECRVLRTPANTFPKPWSVCLIQPQTGDFLLSPTRFLFPPKTQKSGFFPSFGKITSDTQS